MIQVTSRERWLAIAMAAVIAVWALNAFALKPTRARIRTLQRVLPERQAQLRDLQAESAEYRALQKASQQVQAKLAAQNADFQLLPYLETLIERQKLAGHVPMMQPEEASSQTDYAPVVVTMDMHDVSLQQLVDFLAALESAQAVIQVGTLHIRKDATNEALLDCTIGIVSPRLAPHASPGRLARTP